MSATPPGASDWLYFKLYLGGAVDRFDALIEHTLSRVLRDASFDCWFFLRYVDPTGVHLRLRLKPVAGETEPQRRRVEAICRQVLGELPTLAVSSYRSLVPTPRTTGLDYPVVAPRRGVTTATRLAAEPYEPEWATYGGPTGMPIAERTFEVSSGIALAVLEEEIAGRCSRKSVAPGLMDTVRGTLIPRYNVARFWRDYSLYWLGGESAAASDWRARFREKGRRLHEAAVPVVTPPDDLTPRMRALVTGWQHRLADAKADYARLHRIGAIDLERLSLNFAHLMNNRLGLTVLEEAYLGALLEGAAEREDQA